VKWYKSVSAGVDWGVVVGAWSMLVRWRPQSYLAKADFPGVIRPNFRLAAIRPEWLKQIGA
jgi:hypothetical protein